MSKEQLIKFLLKQLAENDQDRDRFNLVSWFKIGINGGKYSLGCYKKGEIVFELSIGEYYDRVNFMHLTPSDKQYFIRTCLSRVNGEAVLGVLEGESKEYKVIKNHWLASSRLDTSLISCKLMDKNEALYEAFDFPLRNGETLSKAVQAIHFKMLELVPEYQEFDITINSI